MISATLGLNINPLLQGLQTVRGHLSSLADMSNIFTGASIFGDKVWQGVTAVFDDIKASLDLGGEFADLHNTTGQSIEDIAVLQQAFKDYGVGADSVEGLTKKFHKALSGINEEGQPTNKTLAALRLNMAEFRKLDFLDQIQELQPAFAAVRDPVERTRMAVDLFGKSGNKMLGLLSDPTAFGTAEERVGSFGRLMADVANDFDDISDNLATVGAKGREVFAGALSRIAPSLMEPLDRLTRMDLTKVGVQIGDMVVGLGGFAGQLQELMPLLKALALHMAITFAVGRTQALLSSNAFTALTQAIQNPREALQGLQIVLARSGAGGFIATATAGLRAMLNSSLAVTAAIAGVMYGWDKFQQRRNAVSGAAFGQVSEELDEQRVKNIDSLGKVGSEEEKSALIESLNQQIDGLHKRIKNVDQEFASLGSSSEADEERSRIRERLDFEARSIDILIRKTQNLSDAKMRSNAAPRTAAAAVAEQTKEVEKLEEAYKKLREAKIKSVIDQLSPEQQQRAVLNQVGQRNVSDLDRAIEIYRKNMADRGTLDPTGQDKARLDEQQRRLAGMIDVRDQLLAIERKITDERKKQADLTEQQRKQEQEAANKRREFAQTSGLEIAKLLADSRGDQTEVDRIDRLQRYFAAVKEAIDAGNGIMQADVFAREKVAAQDAKTNADKEQDKSRKTERDNPVVSGMRRIAGGGGGGGADLMLREAQRQHRELVKQTGLLEKIEKRLKPTGSGTAPAGPAKFR